MTGNVFWKSESQVIKIGIFIAVERELSGTLAGIRDAITKIDQKEKLLIIFFTLVLGM